MAAAQDHGRLLKILPAVFLLIFPFSRVLAKERGYLSNAVRPRLRASAGGGPAARRRVGVHTRTRNTKERISGISLVIIIPRQDLTFL
jgi:hypothetical protein